MSRRPKRLFAATICCLLAVTVGCVETDLPDQEEEDSDLPRRENPDDTGPPDTSGQEDSDTADDPEPDASPDSGTLDDSGMPEDTGEPEDSGTPDDTGSPEDTWTPPDTQMPVDTATPDTGQPDTGMPLDTTMPPDTTDTAVSKDADTNPGPPQPAAGDVVVTEFMASPTALPDSDAEYIEFYNTSGTQAFDLDGCTIADRGSDSETLSATGTELVVQAGDHITLATSQMPGFAPDYVYGQWYLSSGDEIILTCSGQTVDEVDYDGWTSGPNSGKAFGVDPASRTASANDTESNWCDQTSSLPNSADTGTPGAANDGCGTTMPTQRAPAAAGDVVITEFMADPDALGDGDAEWFEIYNPSQSTTWELNGCTIADLGSDSHTIAPTSGTLTVAPGSYVTLAKSMSPGFAPDYVYGSNWYLSNGGDEIELECGATTIDTVDYDNGPDWNSNGPTAGAAKGLDPMSRTAAANDDGDNWCDQTTTLPNSMDKGTPGAANDTCTP